MASRSKAKGDRFERQVVDLLKSYGFEAAKVPLSGAAGGKFSGDVHFNKPGSREVWTVECKSRDGARYFKTLIDWKGNHDILLLRETGNTTPFVFMNFDDFMMFAGIEIEVV